MTRRGVALALAVALVLAVAVIAGVAAFWLPDHVASRPSAERSSTAPSSPAGGAAAAGEHGKPVVRIAVAGDTGTGTAAQDSVATEMDRQSREDPYDALLLLGDLIYNNGDASKVSSRITGPYAPVLDDGAELIPVLGNHDYKSDEEGQIMTRLGRSSTWYVDQVGPVRVIVLDSNRVDDAAQTRWLERTLAEAVPPQTWTIAAMHHPAYSAGDHGPDTGVREHWVPLFAKYHVPLVLAGHDHDYERTTPQQGVTYVVSGAGAKLRPVGHGPWTAVSTSTLEYLDLAVYGDHLTGTAIDPNGNTLDTFTLSR